MEYTKDVVLKVNYNSVPKGNKKWTRSILNSIKKHKFILSAVISAIIFMGIDVVLVTSFFNILRMF